MNNEIREKMKKNKYLQVLKRRIDSGINNFKRSKTFRIEKNTSKNGNVDLGVLLLAHSLEKGMGLENSRKVFGINKANMLLGSLKSYAKNNETNCFAFKEGISVLSAYIEYSKEYACKDVEKVESDFISFFDTLKVESLEAGVEIVDVKVNAESFRKEDAIKSIQTRHSIRSYESIPVDENLMRNIISLALHAPSACNRQPVRVYWASKTEVISEIDRIIPGNKGFKGAIPNWAIVTVDRGMFGQDEALQWYVNGGIFLAFLIQSMHIYGLGSCMFQIPVASSSSSRLHEIAEIGASEAIVAAVGFGYPKDKVKCLKAARKPVDEIMIEI